VLCAEVVEVAHEGERLDPGAGRGRQVARQAAQAEDASPRAVKEAQRLGKGTQHHRLIEGERVDGAAAQPLLGDDVLEHREGSGDRRHARVGEGGVAAEGRAAAFPRGVDAVRLLQRSARHVDRSVARHGGHGAREYGDRR